MGRYLIGIDQSTQGTKALLLDEHGALLRRCDVPHAQIVNEKGWVEHDPIEILNNVCAVTARLLRESGLTAADIAGVGLSNQRETGVCWDRATGEPVCNAIVWQCARAKELCTALESGGLAPIVKEHTGINLSPYFTAAKLAWIIQYVPGAKERNDRGELCFGTVDSWLLYRLSGGKCYKTDYSNASRTQLFNIRTLQWDPDICRAFGIDLASLPEVCGSDSLFCQTDFLGALDAPVPMHAVLGDSHAALYGQGCHTRGLVKSTYGTGSSVMMNIGPEFAASEHIVTSLAWGIGGQVDYVLEGNINYSAAVITWLKDDLGLISGSKDCASLAEAANPEDTTYLIPAFSGLGAPYWASDAKASLVGMTRSTRRQEIVRAAEESIAFQIPDVLRAMQADSGIPVSELRVDGGPTHDRYLMQFQSDMLGCDILVPEAEELSGLGAAYLAGISLGIYDKATLFARMKRSTYHPQMAADVRARKYDGWQCALQTVLHTGR